MMLPLRRLSGPLDEGESLLLGIGLFPEQLSCCQQLSPRSPMGGQVAIGLQIGIVNHRRLVVEAEAEALEAALSRFEARSYPELIVANGEGHPVPMLRMGDTVEGGEGRMVIMGHTEHYEVVGCYLSQRFPLSGYLHLVLLAEQGGQSLYFCGGDLLRVDQQEMVASSGGAANHASLLELLQQVVALRQGELLLHSRQQLLLGVRSLRQQPQQVGRLVGNIEQGIVCFHQHDLPHLLDKAPVSFQIIGFASHTLSVLLKCLVMNRCHDRRDQLILRLPHFSPPLPSA